MSELFLKEPGMKKVAFLTKNGQNITISAVINVPQGFGWR
jgi:hypothetical protein